ncbi:MAG TPA: hypothetical protein VKF42_11615 [Chitinivibrionales bacterium]|nr:hypothetical protein [Chitinivibrionales bacterium]
MPTSIKEQIHRARIDCRVRRRHLRYYGMEHPGGTGVFRPAGDAVPFVQLE